MPVRRFPGALSADPIFAPLRPAIAQLPQDRWPTHEELSALSTVVRFVPPAPHTPYYERQIAATREVPTRPENWHDLFNALVWITFPRAKLAINAQHAAILEERGAAEARRRSPERDALTLFDEGGVVVQTSSSGLTKLIVDFHWKELFWHRREELVRTTTFTCFGHACYEQALAPYIGMVAKTVFLPPGPVDELLAAHYTRRENFPSPRAMAPMPVLGVPGWDPRNEREEFYDDSAHFRSKRN